MNTDISIHAHLSYDGKILFDHLDLVFKKGKFTCLLGPSGIGKSSLLRLIALEHPVAYMAQTDLLLPWLNALDNAMIGTRLRGTSSRDIRKQAKVLLAKVGLAHAEKKYPRQLSAGMRQRVALVRTLLENKSIVLMDEPFSAIDAVTRFELQSLAVELLQNRTVILVTHDPLEALRMADEIYVLSDRPVKLELAAELNSPAPRDMNDAELIQHQGALFAALVRAKECYEK